MRIKKTLAFAMMICLAIIFNAVFNVSAQAQTFAERIPTFGLYCKNAEVLKSATVKFDLSDAELLSKGNGITQSDYHVTATHETEFAIPFISSATNVPPIELTVNGQAVECSVWYGAEAFSYNNDFDTEDVHSPVLDDSITGTLYTVIPDSDMITISLVFNEKRSFIYETSDDSSLSHSSEGSYTWILRDALSRPSYRFFVVGDATDYSFSSSCEYVSSMLTCKEFIDEQYANCSEYYDDDRNVSNEFFYSLVNAVLRSNTCIQYDELFLNSVDVRRINAYMFTISNDSDSVISYEMPVKIQRNYAFSPLIYLIEQKQFGHYITTYISQLNEDVPYIIESSVATERNGVNYKAQTTDDFYIVFSASKKPVNILSNNTEDGPNKAVIIICVVILSIVFVSFVLMYLDIRRRKSHH